MIPRVAHLIWLGPPMRQQLRDAVAVFKALHPGWDICWWGEGDLDRFGLTNHPLYDRAEELVPQDSVYQFRSDIARYEVLYRHGGVYLDPDFHWNSPLDPLVRDRDFLISWEVDGKFVANGLMGATRGHPILREMIDTLAQTVDHNPNRADWRANRITGTHVLSPIVKRHGVTPVPQETFCPVPWNNPDLADDPSRFPESVAVHFWNHQKEIRGHYGD